MKYLRYRQQFANQYFWRTYDQKEIDYLEEADGLLRGYEFKWNPAAKVKAPTDFLQAYHSSTMGTNRPQQLLAILALTAQQPGDGDLTLPCWTS